MSVKKNHRYDSISHQTSVMCHWAQLVVRLMSHPMVFNTLQIINTNDKFKVFSSFPQHFKPAALKFFVLLVFYWIKKGCIEFIYLAFIHSLY